MSRGAGLPASACVVTGAFYREALRRSRLACVSGALAVISTSGLEPRRRVSRKVRRHVVIWILVAWAVAAYFVAPWAWERYLRRHPQFADVPGLTQTADGHPGDPLNVAIVGTEEELVRGMHAAGWVPADPITFRSSLRIVADSLLKRPDTAHP